MKNDNRINPIGLKGNEINERMKQLMGITQLNENKSTSVVELTKVGPDGKVYGIVRENHEYYIKTTDKTSNLVTEDFKYIGGLQNKKQEAYPSYAKAIKHLNLNFKSLAEAYGKGGDINVFENDNLLTENAFNVGFSSNIGNGFSNEGNMEHNTPLLEEGEEVKNNPWAICRGQQKKVGKDKMTDAEVESCILQKKEEFNIDENITENEYCGMEEGLSEAEQAVEGMMGRYDEELDAVGDEDDDVNNDGKKDEKDKYLLHRREEIGKSIAKQKDGSIQEHKLSIARALSNMDSIIDSLTEGEVKKKLYTLK